MGYAGPRVRNAALPVHDAAWRVGRSGRRTLRAAKSRGISLDWRARSGLAACSLRSAGPPRRLAGSSAGLARPSGRLAGSSAGLAGSSGGSARSPRRSRCRTRVTNGGDDAVEEYGSDLLGNLTSAKGPAGAFLFTRDPLGRVGIEPEARWKKQPWRGDLGMTSVSRCVG